MEAGLVVLASGFGCLPRLLDVDGKMLKPGVAPHTHFFLAAFLWAIVGLVLFGRGVLWLVESGGVWWSVPAVLAGTLKSLFLLDRIAQKNVARISRFGKSYCLGGVYSARSWFLVLAMILLGRFLRHSGLPIVLAGFIYVAIGWGLFFSSRLVWLQWFKGQRRESAE